MIKHKQFNFLFQTLIVIHTCSLATPVKALDIDLRAESLSCSLEEKGARVNCDYRYSGFSGVKDVSLKIGGQAIQIPDKGVTNYPAEGQSTAVLILVDVSDPNRRATVEKKNVEAISEIIHQKKTHQKIGIAIFDSDIRVLAPIGSDAVVLKNALANIKASGQATEFYKNIISAISLLGQAEANRKGLIVLSDGKDEDRAYKHADVIKAAKEAGVAIMGLGYLERPIDSPYLQTLKRLSDETYGIYFDATDQTLPAELKTKPFSFVEKGGRVKFGADSFVGRSEIKLVFRTNEDKILTLATTLDIPDYRPWNQRIMDFVSRQWMYLIGVVLALIALVAITVRYWRRRKSSASQVIQYAILQELDGSKTSHTINKTAVRIGRSTDNDVKLMNDSISSHHAEIHRKREGVFYIVDLNSSNGVYVNEKKITQIELHSGDILELGEVRLRFIGK
jgi:hypothetical protein